MLNIEFGMYNWEQELENVQGVHVAFIEILEDI